MINWVSSVFLPNPQEVLFHPPHDTEIIFTSAAAKIQHPQCSAWVHVCHTSGCLGWCRRVQMQPCNVNLAGMAGHHPRKMANPSVRSEGGGQPSSHARTPCLPKQTACPDPPWDSQHIHGSVSTPRRSLSYLKTQIKPVWREGLRAERFPSPPHTASFPRSENKRHGPTSS